MKLALCLALIVSSVYCNWDNDWENKWETDNDIYRRDTTTKKLIRTNLNSPFKLSDLCRTAQKEKFWLTGSILTTTADVDDDIREYYDVDDLDTTTTSRFFDTDNFGTIRKQLHKKVVRKVNQCCNKINHIERKECLKDIKDIVRTRYDDIDIVRDTDDLFLNTMVDVDSRDEKYTTWSDMLRTTDTDDVTRRMETIMEDVDDLTYGTSDKYDRLLRKCTQDNMCRRKLERATDFTSRKACTDNTLKSDRDSTSTCCKAGRTVGLWVGKMNKDVCMPALYKFQTKIQGCGSLNLKNQCRRGFVTCCIQASKMAKEITETTLDTMEDKVLLERRMFDVYEKDF